MVDTWLAPAVISSAIAGAVAMATHFSAQKAQRSESREDIRTEAFEQAKLFYLDVIERQDKELDQLRGQVSEALRRSGEAERAADVAKAAVRKVNVELGLRSERIVELEALTKRLAGGQ